MDQFGVPHGKAGKASLPNGSDFWWDEFATNSGNCWYENTGADGTPDSVAGPGGAGRMPGSPPNPLPDCAGGTGSSTGQGDIAKEAHLVDCSNGPDDATGPLDCDRWSAPEEPGSPAARRRARAFAVAARKFERSAEAQRLRARIAALTGGG